MISYEKIMIIKIIVFDHNLIYEKMNDNQFYIKKRVVRSLESENWKFLILIVRRKTF